jgi:hypothetical protein
MRILEKMVESNEAHISYRKNGKRAAQEMTCSSEL